MISNVVGVSATTHKLNVTPVRQEKSNWCWAATTRMIIDYLHTWSPVPSQTNIVTTVKGSPVNEGASDAEMTNALNWYMVSTTPTDGNISFSDIKRMLSGWYSPIETSIIWTATGKAHAQVIYGYEENGVYQGVYVLDPDQDATQYCYYDYADYKFGSTFGWRYTWYNNKRAS